MPDKFSDLAGTSMAAGWAILWALAGRMLYVLHSNRRDRRRIWTWATAYELAVALGMGIVAGGCAEYLGLTGLANAGFVAAASYLGPPLIDTLLSVIIRGKTP